MKLLEKYTPESCFAMEAEVYERLASAVRPDRRFVDHNVDERHVIVVDDDWKPVMIFYVKS